MDYAVSFIQILAYLMKLAILARALVSWTRPDPYNPLVRSLYRVTEPILQPFRRILPAWRGLDLSPVAALVAIQLAEWIVVRLILF